MATPKKLYILACFTVVAIWQINLPYLFYFIYPLNLLATWSHEMGHGITAMLLGGEFSHLKIYLNGSGVAYYRSSSDLSNAITAAGGLLGPCIIGFIMVSNIKSEKSAGYILGILSVSLLISLALFVRNPSGIGIVVVLALLIYGLNFLKGRIKIFAAQFLSAQLMLSPLQNWRYLFMEQANVGGKIIKSDVSQIASNFFLPIPSFAWGIFIAFLTLFLFTLSLKDKTQ
ncbi:MAG: M50 family metallopeptidase [Nitrospinae bacterium]|nr:M50 family metallopeptidase [Nitrospinota bacterium]